MGKSILIAEDDVLISLNLKRIVKQLNYSISAIVSNVDKFNKQIKIAQPDFALLDIQMQGKNEGVAIAKKLNTLNIPFAFITSFNDKKTLQEAVLLQPVGYILKPFTKKDVFNVLNTYFNINFWELKSGKTIYKIKINNIIYIKSDNVYADIYLSNDKKIVVREKLENLLNQLPPDVFSRVHRSFIVNNTKIEKFNQQSVFIEDIEIPISKKYATNIL